MAKQAPGARVVKAFNTTFANIIQSQAKGFGDNRPTGFYCGDDSEAKKIVAGANQGYRPGAR